MAADMSEASPTTDAIAAYGQKILEARNLQIDKANGGIRSRAAPHPGRLLMSRRGSNPSRAARTQRRAAERGRRQVPRARRRQEQVLGNRAQRPASARTGGHRV